MECCSEYEVEKLKALAEITRLAEANKKAEAELAAAKEDNRQLVEAATPLVDSLVPPEGENADRPFLERLHRASGELRSYIRDAAHACVVQILGVVKALLPNQDMTPFATGDVPGVTDEDFSLLEEQVQPIADAIMERLDF